MMGQRTIAIIFNVVLLTICCLAAISSAEEVQFGDKHVFVQKREFKDGAEDMHLLVLTWAENAENRQVEDCEMILDPKVVAEVLRAEEDPRILEVTHRYMENLKADCNAIARRRRRRDVPNLKDIMFSQTRGQEDETSGNEVGEKESSWVIFPGTLWCGAGDNANNKEDLGTDPEPDKCCRTHDFCDDLILSGGSKHNLTNNSPVTKLSCKCDSDFYDCLEKVDTNSANMIGKMYFNMLSNECYELDYVDSEECKEYKTFLNMFCSVYKKDESLPKAYQWKEAKSYEKSPFSFF